MRIRDWSSDVCSSDLLELLKPELLLEEAKIESTLVIYGSARIPEPDIADGLEAAATDDAARTIARRLKAKAKYYDEARRSEEHTSELPSLMRISYAVFCLKKNTNIS